MLETRFALTLATLMLTLAATTGLAEEAADDPFGWIVGNWHGAKGDSRIEETWSTRDGDNQMGMFRLVSDGTVRFYEFMSIEFEEGEEPVLRIKHFNKGLVGWEEREESEVFHLTFAEPGRAVFAQRVSEVPTRLIYTREGDRLTVVLEKDRPEGTSRSEFPYTLR